ncbi:hypothetical protein ACFP9V_19190 [Deinococcus radiopugnans]|uniref:Uncharacterized protein n=1 Tax=Deinococcus radiopugnans ATCC 19172 TaxID=585398 RepID=A0A5C4Y7K1_9DEIO|nr:hypothetical protein [Deinococcus radiopugnans]MBB6016831.1 hypothetical protein [Deinococcus radiopugnans ATCC 19172]TNM71882.1 hypothetical protein FHR04_05810 [Deinococcus radiopugnans ATCC 19172]
MVQEDALLLVHDGTETTGLKESTDRSIPNDLEDAELNHAETHRNRNQAQVKLLVLSLGRANG